MQIAKGIAAGFIATVVLSAFMLLKAKMGMLPEMNAIKLLSGMSHKMAGTPAMPAVGWFWHFLIGSVLWGGLFAAFHRSLPGASEVTRAVWLSVLAWLAMMIVVMPVAGKGLFALSIGPMAAVATLVLHIIFGVALGYSFDRFTKESKTEVDQQQTQDA